MGIGYLGSGNDLFHGGIVYTESNVVEETVVEQDGFLIYITYQSAEVFYYQIFNIFFRLSEFHQPAHRESGELNRLVLIFLNHFVLPMQ